MLHIHKRVFMGIVFLLLLAACERGSYSGTPTSVFIITPAQDPYIQAFIDYLGKREKEGLETKSTIQVESDDSFLFLMRPAYANVKEVSDDEMQDIMELALTTVNVFESRKGFRHEDIDVPFTRPVSHRIVVVKDNNMPELLANLGEVTVSIDNKYYTSIINLAGPNKNGSQEYANAWAVVQALCLAYAGDFPDADGVCNILAANSAAGWIGMDAGEAEKLINGYGTTDLGYLGSKDYNYRYIPFVFDEFAR